MIVILAALAEFERERIQERVLLGLARANVPTAQPGMISRNSSGSLPALPVV
jgi:DNA invertase Pin-like site-specific DNA recombinase